MRKVEINAVHEPTPACHGMHCYSCHVDERFKGFAYRVCFECGHIYLTPRSLRRAYRRKAWDMLDRNFPWVRGNEFYPSVLGELWAIATVRAKNIAFCQECLHDF